MIRNTTRNQKLGWVLFLLYLALLAYFVIFAESLGRDPSAREYSYNLVLFREIKRFYLYRDQLGMEAFLLNDVGNIAAFMPFGFFLPVVSRRSRQWRMTLFLSFCCSLCIELTQLIFRVGSFDVDDILLNTVGGILGYLSFCAVQGLRIQRRRRSHRKQAARGKAAARDGSRRP